MKGVLANRYEVKVLDSGDPFEGIACLDRKSNEMVGVREFPAGPAGRDAAAREKAVTDRLAQAGFHGVVRIHRILVEGEATRTVEDLVVGSPVDRSFGPGGATAAEALLRFRDVCRTVAALHIAGGLHLGLCPGAIRIEEELGSVRLTGFGLAFRDPTWTAPEILAGGGDARSDLFSLGRLLDVLTRPPVLADGETRPAGVEALVAALTRDEPSERPSSAGEIADIVASWVKDPPPDRVSLVESVQAGLRNWNLRLAIRPLDDFIGRAVSLVDLASGRVHQIASAFAAGIGRWRWGNTVIARCWPSAGDAVEATWTIGRTHVVVTRCRLGFDAAEQWVVDVHPDCRFPVLLNGVRTRSRFRPSAGDVIRFGDALEFAFEPAVDARTGFVDHCRIRRRDAVGALLDYTLFRDRLAFGPPDAAIPLPDWEAGEPAFLLPTGDPQRYAMRVDDPDVFVIRHPDLAVECRGRMKACGGMETLIRTGTLFTIRGRPLLLTRAIVSDDEAVIADLLG